MFNFSRKNSIKEEKESFQEIERIVRKLEKDGDGRIRIKDLETALQRLDERIRSKVDDEKRVGTFREFENDRARRENLSSLVKTLQSKGDRIDGEKFLQIMLERQKQLKLRFVQRNREARKIFLVSFSDLVSKNSI